MSLFIEAHCKFDGDPIVSNLCWSHSDPIAAVATSSEDNKGNELFQVLFLNNEGVLLKNSSINHDKEATVMDWQPNGRLLAIGWADGMVSCWTVDGRNRPTSTYSNTSQHSSSVTMILWNPLGKRVISGDQGGVVNVWSVDARGTLSPTRQYRKNSKITKAVFCTITPSSSSRFEQNSLKGSKPVAARKAEIKQLYSPAFFFGTEKGNLVYADDLGHCADVQQVLILNNTVLTYCYFPISMSSVFLHTL